jgi:hypothetical protein
MKNLFDMIKDTVLNLKTQLKTWSRNISKDFKFVPGKLIQSRKLKQKSLNAYANLQTDYLNT